MAAIPKRRLRRFFTSVSFPKVGESFQLSPEETHHLAHLIRLKEGDECLVFNSAGQQIRAKIIPSEDSHRARLTVEEIVPISHLVQTPQLHIYIAMPQKGKMDWIIEKAQEIGVHRIIPIETERTVVKISKESERKVLDRWLKIIQAAQKQSGNLKAIELSAPEPYKKAILCIQEEGKVLFFHPYEGGSVKHWIEEEKSHGVASDYHLFFGPEGGFSKVEFDLAKQQNAEIISLGEEILKVETAFLAAASILKWML